MKRNEDFFFLDQIHKKNDQLLARNCSAYGFTIFPILFRQTTPNKRTHFLQDCRNYVRKSGELKKTTMTTATVTSLNKWFNKQNNGCARAL